MYAAENPTNTRYNAHIRTTTHGMEILRLREQGRHCNIPAADDLSG